MKHSIRDVPADNFTDQDNLLPDDILITHQAALRKLVGILGMSLPILLFISLFLFSGHHAPLDSISHYYYTRSGTLFIIVVSLLAIFLLVYKGKEPIDLYLSSVAGIFAICLLLFPTGNITDVCCDREKRYAVTVLAGSGLRVWVHYFSAALFLGCLAFMSLFLFTKSEKPGPLRTRGKIMRNRVYRTCGILMMIALAAIALNAAGILSDDIFNRYHLTFWMETLAIEGFGISWLVKGETIFRDR